MDERARRRLGLDWDECIIWAGMDVRKESGSVLGYVDDVVFSPRTGRVKSVSVSEGGMANAMVGTISIESGQIVGYRDGHMVVSDDVDERALSGGFAARAGEATARAKIAAGEASAKASKVVGDAVDVGSHKLGRALGKAKRAVVEATQEEPEPAEVEAEQVAVESVPAKATRPPEKPSTKKPSAKKAAGKAAKAAARQLGKTRGMFGAFIDEFEKSSK